MELRQLHSFCQIGQSSSQHRSWLYHSSTPHPEQLHPFPIDHATNFACGTAPFLRLRNSRVDGKMRQFADSHACGAPMKSILPRNQITLLSAKGCISSMARQQKIRRKCLLEVSGRSVPQFIPGYHPLSTFQKSISSTHPLFQPPPL